MRTRPPSPKPTHTTRKHPPRSTAGVGEGMRPCATATGQCAGGGPLRWQDVPLASGGPCALSKRITPLNPPQQTIA